MCSLRSHRAEGLWHGGYAVGYVYSFFCSFLSVFHFVYWQNIWLNNYNSFNKISQISHFCIFFYKVLLVFFSRGTLLFFLHFWDIWDIPSSPLSSPFSIQKPYYIYYIIPYHNTREKIKYITSYTLLLYKGNIDKV